ncbi:fimbrin [Balamuthia mandrillaris]
MWDPFAPPGTSPFPQQQQQIHAPPMMMMGGGFPQQQVASPPPFSGPFPQQPYYGAPLSQPAPHHQPAFATPPPSNNWPPTSPPGTGFGGYPAPPHSAPPGAHPYGPPSVVSPPASGPHYPQQAFPQQQQQQHYPPQQQQQPQQQPQQRRQSLPPHQQQPQTSASYRQPSSSSSLQQQQPPQSASSRRQSSSPSLAQQNPLVSELKSVQRNGSTSSLQRPQQPQARSSSALQAPPSTIGGGDKSKVSPRRTAPLARMGETKVERGQGESKHAYSTEETRSFAQHINEVLGNDPDLKKHLLLNPHSTELFDAIAADGLLLCKLVNHVRPGTIAENMICKKPNMNPFELRQNLIYGIEGCKRLGLVVVNIGPEDIKDKTPHLILGLLWQIIKLGLMDAVSVEKHPNLVTLMEEGENVQDFVNLPPEETLLRWFNYHLKRAGHPRRVRNFGSDIADSENYLVLLNQLNPSQCRLDALQEQNLERRAEAMLQNADKVGCRKFVEPIDVVLGNPKLNLAFVANLFNNNVCLEDDRSGEQQRRLQAEAEAAMRQKLADEERRLREQWQAQEAEWRRQLEEERRRQEQLLNAETAARMNRLNQEEAAARERLRREEEESKRRLQDMERAKQEQWRRENEERNRQRMMEEQKKMEEARRLDEARRRQQAAEEEARRQQQQQQWLYQQQQQQLAMQQQAWEQEQQRQRQEWEEQQRRLAMQQQTTTTTTTHHYHHQKQPDKVIVKVLKARRLAKMDKFGIGKPDPYATVTYRDQTQTTRAIYDTKDPTWNQEFTIHNFDPAGTTPIHVEVYDKETLSKDTFLGHVRVTPSQVVSMQGSPEWFTLQSSPKARGRVKGDILLQLKLC